MTAPLIAILGSGGTTMAANLDLAREAGTALARRGAHVVAGGAGGVFEAACAGAQAAGGTAVLLLGESRRPDRLPEGTLAIATGLGAARHAVMATACDGALVIEGWAPTLALVAEFAALGKPVVALRGTGGAADATAGKPLIPGGKGCILEAGTVDEAVALLLKS